MFENEEKKACCSESNCVAKAHQTANVCVPITVTPFANVSGIKTECCGKPVISFKPVCKGIENGSCKFTVSQKIKVEIPVEFGANTNVGGTFVECDCRPPKDCGEEEYDFIVEDDEEHKEEHFDGDVH